MTRKRLTITAVVDTDSDSAQDHYDHLVKASIDTPHYARFLIGNEYVLDPAEGDTLISLDIQVSDPPREWKFGDIVTQDDHPDTEFRAYREDSYAVFDLRDFRAYSEEWHQGPWRLVWVEGQDL